MTVTDDEHAALLREYEMLEEVASRLFQELKDTKRELAALKRHIKHIEHRNTLPHDDDQYMP